MKAIDIMNELFALAYEHDFSETCDTCKSGDPETEVAKVALTMFPTPEVIRQASRWGAQLLITHEPAYYNHMDIWSHEQIECEKRALLEQTGMVLFRYHDHPHYTSPDIITAGQLRQLGLEGEVSETDVLGCLHLLLKTPITPLGLARLIEERLHVKHPRICGTRELPCSSVAVMVGSPDPRFIFEQLKRPENEIVLAGETCEWQSGEYARDADQLGHKKSLIILGHSGSERYGMKYTADILKEKHPELDIRYFDCGEVYTYTDSEGD